MAPAARNIILAAVIAAVFAGGLWWFHYVPDDAYIGMRYARNAASGEGLVFNPGERVEGYTGFLWVIIMATASKAGIPTAAGARVISLLFSAGTLILTWIACAPVIAGRGNKPAGTGVAAAAPLILAASTPFTAWALSGTGIPMFTFLLTAGMLFISTGRETRPTLTIFAILTLVFPEGAAFFVLAAILLIIRGESPRRVAAEGILVAALFLVPYIVWKISYFGGVLPNTFYAKTGAPAAQLRNGLSYTARFAAWYIWLPAAALIFRNTKERNDTGKDFGTVIVPVSIIILNWVIAALAGGASTPQFGLLVPSLPAIAVMAAAVIPRIVMTQEKIPRGRAGAWQSAALAVIFTSIAMAPGSSGHAVIRRERLMVKAFGWVGEELAARLPEGTSLGCGSTGAIGFYSGLPVVDILGLTEPEIARKGKIVSDQPGRMKSLGSHVLDRDPDLLLLGNIQVHSGKRLEDLGRIKVQERDIILDTRFSDNYEFINIPLGDGFFLSCYGRSGSAVFSE